MGHPSGLHRPEYPHNPMKTSYIFKLCSLLNVLTPSPQSTIVESMYDEVIPHEVARQAMVLANSLHGMGREMWVRSLATFVGCHFMGRLISAHWKLFQHACLFRGYLRVNPRTSLLSTLPFPLFASRACNTVESGLI